MRVIEGDIVSVIEELTQGPQQMHTVVLHGCNCQNVMGAGVALALSNRWPEVYQADLQTKRGDRKKLGSWSTAELTDVRATVHNLYTQFRYGPAHERNFSYEAFELCCWRLRERYSPDKVRFVFPLIGTGNAGGRWSAIKRTITEQLGDFELILVKGGYNGTRMD